MSGINTSYKSFPLIPKGDKVDMKVTDTRHYNLKSEVKTQDVGESFAATLKSALEAVNDQQSVADELTQKMIVNPNSVDAHEVMIAAEKARISLTFTKTLVDGVIRAYRELSNLR
ncbi:MAG: flagellar hook-basal body complex protein FliE [Leptospiraceae bacterium]|nr:flagellar hook-basal body complex protein FliE [Leptospiraceae bacterium]